jgi:hypothetical protein
MSSKEFKDIFDDKIENTKLYNFADMVKVHEDICNEKEKKTEYKIPINKRKEVIDWALNQYPGGLTCGNKVSNETKKKEREWGNDIIGQQDNNNWTTKLSEGILHDIIKYNGHNIRKPAQKDRCQPDWETDDFIIESKVSNWTISGTAGEKVLGAFYKYSDVPRLYGKPLKIVCIAYQEYECSYGRESMRLFGEGISNEKKEHLILAKKHQIEFVKFSDFIKDYDIESFIKSTNT